MTEPCFLGIDLGTSGCRAVAIDDRGNELASTRTSLPASRRGPDGESEQEPAAWWQAVAGTVQQLIRILPRHRPAAIAVDGTSATLVLVDERGNPLTPGLMYDDQRAGSQARELEARIDSELAGAVASPASSLAKLLWLRDRGLLSPGCRALHQSEWITARLSGRFDLGDENNALKMGYDPVRGEWPAWMEVLGLPAELLPRILPPGSLIGSIQSSAARQTGLPAGCQVVAGTTDSTAAALAAGVKRPGEAVTSLGSTLVTKILLERPLFSRELGVYSHRILGLWLAGGASNSGGAVLRQFFSDMELETLSQGIDPNRGLCLEYYPLPRRGERFPIRDPRMEPRMQPVPRDRARFLQALLEGIARVEVLAYRRLEALGAPRPRQVFTSGGGAANETWRRIRQRMLKVPVIAAGHAEAAFGAARLARWGWTNGTGVRP